MFDALDLLELVPDVAELIGMIWTYQGERRADDLRLEAFGKTICDFTRLTSGPLP